MAKKQEVSETWRSILSGTIDTGRKKRHLFSLIPSDPRCRFCNAPFFGVGAPLMRTIFRKRPSKLNPRFCNVCDDFVTHHLGGAEIELTMLFADVRGSTALAEKSNPLDFTRLMNRFYAATMNVLAKTDAWTDKIVGDEVIGLYIPGFAGPDHARVAIEAAKEILRTTGHDREEGPWLPVGIGVHTGVAFVGTVGSEEGITNVTALGDAMNITARLVARAAAGEILASEDACKAAGPEYLQAPRRQLKLRGRKNPVAVRILRIASA